MITVNRLSVNVRFHVKHQSTMRNQQNGNIKIVMVALNAKIGLDNTVLQRPWGSSDEVMDESAEHQL